MWKKYGCHNNSLSNFTYECPTQTVLIRFVGTHKEYLKIHPACIAGKVRFEKNNFRLLAKLVGSGRSHRPAEPGGPLGDTMELESRKHLFYRPNFIQQWGSKTGKKRNPG